MKQNISTVFFDLDGTLADTAPDLTEALNQLLLEHNKEPLTLETVLPAVSKGGLAMLRLGFEFDEASEQYEALRQRFLDIYSQRMHPSTTLFPTMSETLAQLEDKQYRWGIVTNKSTWLAEPLIKKLGLNDRSLCLVCGDTTEYPKPHPAPLLYACQLAMIKPQQSVYVGDAKNDIIAGKAAGMATVAAMYGYIPENENPDDWQADASINSPDDILHWLDAV